MAALGLPDPSDYSAPVNGPQGVNAAPPPPPADPAAESAPAAETEITPFPADPPAISGEMLTENVFQKGV